MVTVVGVFVDPDPAHLAAVLTRVPVDMLQFHGEEEPAFCASVGRPWMKAIGMREGVDVRAAARRYSGARGLLLDTYSAKDKGGTGRSFDWTLIPTDLEMPLVLAGGLDAGNVSVAIRSVRPYAVDVNGGVESAHGIKDQTKMEAFMREVQRAQAA
jgi:phosphoribosylanthranilate isomerase